MEASNRKTPTASHARRVVSKVIVIAPKQIAELGLKNQLKNNVSMGEMLGEIKEAESRSGSLTFKPVKGVFLKNIRSKISTLLSHNTKTEVEVEEGAREPAAAEVVEDRSNDNDENDEVNVKEEAEKGTEIKIISNQSVVYSTEDLNALLRNTSTKRENPTKPILLNDNKPLQEKLVLNTFTSKNLCVPDLSASAARRPKNLPPALDKLIAAKNVVKDAVARSSDPPPPYKIVRTYSKAQAVVRYVAQDPEAPRRVIAIHRKESPTATRRRRKDGGSGDDEDWTSPKRPYSRRRIPEESSVVEEKIKRIMDECKEKDGGVQVAPKKRGRPRKTPLQPKVDIEPDSEKDKSKSVDDSNSESVTPRKRGRPRKISAEADKPSEDTSPKKKGQRRRKSDAEEREYSAPSSTPSGVRTSGRKRKVVDYAALSGGRISSSEEEDFAEIERLTGIKHETSEEESEEETRGVDGDEKEKTPSKSENVHPLKKRLKMEHAQAEREKSEEANDTKDTEVEKQPPPPQPLKIDDQQQNSFVKESPGVREESREVPEQKESGPELLEQNQNNSTVEKPSEPDLKENNSTAAAVNTESSESITTNNSTSDGEKEEPPADAEDNQRATEESKSNDTARRDIACGVCNDTFDSESGWVKHKEGRHNNLAWKVGEPPLDLENYDLVCKTVTVTLKKYGTLVCEVCGEDFSSAFKFVRHANGCKSARVDYERGTQRRSGKSTLGNVIANVGPDSFRKVKKENGNATNENAKVAKFSGEVKCAVCGEIMANVKWTAHKLTKHNNLTWREGEQPLDLNDKKLVVRILQALYKAKKKLRCELCGESKKSVVGFISHKQQCQKSEEELKDIKVTCDICQRAMLPVSLPIHMQLYHSPKTPEACKKLQVDEVSTPRRAARKAIGMIQNYREKNSDSVDSSASHSIVRNVDFFSCDEVISKFHTDIRNNTYATCVYLDCNYQSENIDDLLQHIGYCDNKINKTAYTCNYCLITFGNRVQAHKHLSLHTDKSIEDYIIKEFPDDKNFILNEDVEDEDPLEYVDDSESRVTQSSGVTKISTFTLSKAKFLQCVTAHKNPWVIFPFAVNWTMEFILKNYNVEHLFHCCDIQEDNFKIIPPKDVLKYLPKIRQSPDVAQFNLNDIKDPVGLNYTWKSYKLFEGDISSEGTSTIFCGGPISSLAWAPYPHSESERDQILAVGILYDPEMRYPSTKKIIENSLIQFWNFGPLKNSANSFFKPVLEFCFAHKYGAVMHLEWCPSGCYDSQIPTGNKLKRLGLVAVSCGDSIVYIYSVPQPKEIKGKILECKASIKLCLMKKNDSDIGDIDNFPTKTSWTKHSGHKHIAVGYSTGMVALFILEEAINISNEDTVTVYPKLTFWAHFESIIALSLSHLSGGNRFLITASPEKDLKLWDLEDLSDPTYVHRKFAVSDLATNIHWLTAITSYDCVGNLMPASCIVPLREHNGTSMSFVPFHSTVTSLSANDWGNLFMNCSDTGEVVVSIPDQLNEKLDSIKRKRKYRFLLSYTGIVSKRLSSDENKAIQDNVLRQLKDKKVTPENAVAFGPRTYEEVKNDYGFVICDINSSKKDIQGPNFKHHKLLNIPRYCTMHKPDVYPMQAVTKAALNQNMQAFHHYALGYQLGFVRVSKVGFLNKS